MKKAILYVSWMFLLLSCDKQQTKPTNIDNLTNLKDKFLEQINTCCIDEGPFSFNYTISYFAGKDPLRSTLDLEDIHTFVVDHQDLIIIFQPYVVGGGADSPFIVRIPFTQLVGIWQADNLLEKHLPITKNFISSWDPNNWVSDIQTIYNPAIQLQTKSVVFFYLNNSMLCYPRCIILYLRGILWPIKPTNIKMTIYK